MSVFRPSALTATILATCAQAEELSIAVTLSVVESSGRQIAFYAMPRSFLASADYAFWKAWTVASFSMSTLDFADMLASLPEEVRAGLCDHPHVTTLPGGVPILQDGRLAGAVGISGGSGEQDVELAQLAAETLISAGDQKAPG